MYRDSSLQSPFIQKMRRKYHREYVRKRALDKEAFELRQKVAIEEKKLDGKKKGKDDENVFLRDTIVQLLFNVWYAVFGLGGKRRIEGIKHNIRRLQRCKRCI